MEPFFTENCLPQPLHFHMRRVDRNECCSPLQNGQRTPPGQRRSRANSNAVCSSEKSRTASTRVRGVAVLHMGSSLPTFGRCVKYIIAEFRKVLLRFLI